MMGKMMLGFYVSLALGYVLCILAKKQTSILKTLGYTLGISIMVLTLLSALAASQCADDWKGKMGKTGAAGRGCFMMKDHGMSMKGAK